MLSRLFKLFMGIPVNATTEPAADGQPQTANRSRGHQSRIRRDFGPIQVIRQNENESALTRQPRWSSPVPRFRCVASSSFPYPATIRIPCF